MQSSHCFKLRVDWFSIMQFTSTWVINVFVSIYRLYCFVMTIWQRLMNISVCSLSLIWLLPKIDNVISCWHIYSSCIVFFIIQISLESKSKGSVLEPPFETKIQRNQSYKVLCEWAIIPVESLLSSPLECNRFSPFLWTFLKVILGNVGNHYTWLK